MLSALQQIRQAVIAICMRSIFLFGLAADQTGCYCDLHAEHIVVRLCSRSDRLILHLAYGAKYVCLRILLFGSAAGQTG